MSTNFELLPFQEFEQGAISNFVQLSNRYISAAISAVMRIPEFNNAVGSLILLFSKLKTFRGE
jgi:hypothetical protein